MKLLPIFFLALFVNSGQVIGQLVLTEDDNNAWVKLLSEEKDLSTQLEIIRKRILSDTSVYVVNSADRFAVNNNDDNTRHIGTCRPLLIVEGQVIQLTNETNSQIALQLSNQITLKNIKKLEVLEQNKATVLLGTNAWCGVIIIIPTGKRAKRLLLQYKNMN